jgi:enterobacterial common antigen flippase
LSSDKHSSYRQIFKSTSLIGGAQIIRLAIGGVQVKAMGVLLGPAGVGLAGMYTAAVALIGTISGMGIGSAGVRQIAEAAGSGDEDKVARTIKTLRRTSLFSGVLGMAVAMALCVPLSLATFDSGDYAWGIIVVSLSLLFTSVSAGQMALLQGLRRLRDLAKCNVLGALFGMIASISLVYFFREKGIAWYIVAVSVFAVLASWWYARRVPVKVVQVSWPEMSGEVRALLGMGVAFMTSALFGAGSMYLSRVLVVRTLDLKAVGLYTATVTLSSVYVGMVLMAMGADFYPRLTAAARDHEAMNRLVNEQTEMGVLMALPGILATLVFAPWVLRIFYSPAFVEAADIIRWQILGVALRVVSWPMAFVLLAKGASRIYMLSEFLFNALYVGLIFLCIRLWGLNGLGIAFFLMYLGHVPAMMVVCRWMSGFAWSRAALRLILMSTAVVVLLLLSLRLLPKAYGLATGFLLTLLATAVCFHFLQKLLNVNLAKVLLATIQPKPSDL